MWANSEGSIETVHPAWAVTGHLCDKYYNLMSWLNSDTVSTWIILAVSHKPELQACTTNLDDFDKIKSQLGIHIQPLTPFFFFFLSFF